MFLSKIWFFLVALAAAAALTVALVMPRPAQRQIDGEEKNDSHFMAALWFCDAFST